MADFLSMLTSVPSLISDFSGGTSDPYQKQKNLAAGQMAQISSALTDTSNPLYKQLYGQYQDQNRQNMAQVISEAQGQNRMNTAMGRTPLFDPSRGGETMFRSLMSGYQDLGTHSDQQTRQALAGALGSNGSTLNAYNTAGQGAARANTAQLSGYQGLSDILKNLGTNNNASPNPSQYSAYPNSQFLQPGYVTPNSIPFGSSGWGGY